MRPVSPGDDGACALDLDGAAVATATAIAAQRLHASGNAADGAAGQDAVLDHRAALPGPRSSRLGLRTGITAAPSSAALAPQHADEVPARAAAAADGLRPDADGIVPLCHDRGAGLGRDEAAP